MFPKKLIVGVVLSAIAVPIIANAQSTGTSYAGAGFGKTKFKNGCPAVPAANCNKSDMGFKFFSGYEFNRTFAVEFGLAELGSVSGSGSSFSATGAELVGLAQWPITNNFSVFGKLGGYFAVANATGVANEKSKDLTYGLGLKMDFARNTGVRIEWQRYKDIGASATTGRTDVDYLGASLVQRF